MASRKDPIVEEVRAARDAYAKRFDYDLRKIAADLREKSRARELAQTPDVASSLPFSSPKVGKQNPTS